MKKPYVILLVVIVIVVVGIVALSSLSAKSPQSPTGPASADGTPTPAQSRVILATPEKINAEVGPNDPQIFMLEPQDGVKIDSPFYLRIGVSNLKVPLLSATVHVNINAPCIAAGETIPEDEQHVSLPVGHWEEPRFNLPAGKIRLCIQAADSQNVALEGPGLTRIIDVEILPTPPANND